MNDLKLSRRRFLAAGGAGVAASLAPAVQAGARGTAGVAAAAARPRPTPSQLAWQREELSMFVHFTVNTFTGKEWGDGTESPSIGSPEPLGSSGRTSKRASQPAIKRGRVNAGSE